MRIAHLSDVHMLAERPTTELGRALRRRFLSLGRPLDFAARRAKLLRAIDAARAAGADHFVFSGDLTEIGAPEEIEAFAEALLASGVDPDAVTLVPGNHDAYTEGAWQRALAGPLAPFARGSATVGVRVVEREGLTILPVDTTFHQNVLWADGVLRDAEAGAIEHHASDPVLASGPVVVVMHHAPRANRLVGLLHGAERLVRLFAKIPNLFALHGHLHKPVDGLRTFGAPAIVDDRGAPRVRLYDAIGAALVPVAA